MGNVNRPLVRLIAALPVMAVGTDFDWELGGLAERDFFRLGQEFIAAHGERAMWLYTLGRWACIPFSLVGGWVAWRWASELYGARAGLLALVLWCVCPNILGHGRLPERWPAALSVSVQGIGRGLDHIPGQQQLYLGGMGSGARDGRKRADSLLAHGEAGMGCCGPSVRLGVLGHRG